MCQQNRIYSLHFMCFVCILCKAVVSAVLAFLSSGTFVRNVFCCCCKSCNAMMRPHRLPQIAPSVGDMWGLVDNLLSNIYPLLSSSMGYQTPRNIMAPLSPESPPHTAPRSIQPFLHGSQLCPTGTVDTHTDTLHL